MNSIMKFHPSLKKIFKEIDVWLAYDDNIKSVEKETHYIQTHLNKTDILSKGVISSLETIGHFYVKQASAHFGRCEWESLVQPLHWGVAFRSLAFRFEAESVTTRESRMLPLAFESSMEVAGAAMLSQWQEAELGARSLIEVAEKDQSIRSPSTRKDDWGRGTSDALMIYLLAQAFGLKTTYTPVNELLPEYQALLDHWQTADETLFRQIMQAAADYHISRCKWNTNKTSYEFSAPFNSVFAPELLTIQALRRREGLPEFETGHLLIDTPWAVIRDLPEVEPHPLIAMVEARIKLDYPAFR
jgi:hypothetical protein